MTTLLIKRDITSASKRHCGDCHCWNMSKPDEDGITVPFCHEFKEFLCHDGNGELVRLVTCLGAEITHRQFKAMQEFTATIEQNVAVFSKHREANYCG